MLGEGGLIASQNAAAPKPEIPSIAAYGPFTHINYRLAIKAFLIREIYFYPVLFGIGSDQQRLEACYMYDFLIYLGVALGLVSAALTIACFAGRNRWPRNRLAFAY